MPGWKSFGADYGRGVDQTAYTIYQTGHRVGKTWHTFQEMKDWLEAQDRPPMKDITDIAEEIEPKRLEDKR